MKNLLALTWNMLFKNKKKESILVHHYHELISFLKKQNLHDLPWFFIIGPKSAGKTSLLANAEIHYLLKRSFNDLLQLPHTQQFEFWVTKTAIFIDTPGYPATTSLHHYIQELALFLNFFRKNCPLKTPLGILLVLDLAELTHHLSSAITNYNDNLKKILLTLPIEIKKKGIPIHIVINKCDLLTGFREFFAEYSREERWQPWGFLLKDTQHKSQKSYNLIQQFNKGYSQLIRRIRSQLIYRLHQETNIDRRSLINDFPVQIEQIKNHLSQLMNLFQKQKNLNIQAIYLSSALQKPLSNINTHTPDILYSTQYDLINIQPPTQKAYFIHHVLTELIFQPNENTKKNTNLRRILLLIIPIIGLLLLAGWFLNFNMQAKKITALQNILSNYQNHPKTDQMNDLNVLLNSLTLTESNNSLLKILPDPNSELMIIHKKLLKTYLSTLQTTLLPQITETLKSILINNTTPPNLLYKSLKSYLMLGRSIPYDADYLTNTLKLILSGQINNDVKAHLAYLSKLGPTLLDQPAIKQAQTALKQLNSAQLAYIIFLNNIPHNIDLSLNLAMNSNTSNIFSLSSDQAYIKSMYTASYFEKLYPQALQEAANEAIIGNNIIGNIQDKTPSAEIANQLTQLITKKYTSHYIHAWSQLLMSIKLVPATSLMELINNLNDLTNQDSFILQLMNLIKNNVPAPLLQTNNALNNFIHILDNTQVGDYNSAINLLTSLKDYLSKIAISSDPNQSAFEAASYRMINNGYQDPIEQIFSNATQYPEPLRSWLNQIASNAWTLIMQQTQSYINQAWQQEIYSQYQAQLANRYPFASMSSQQISIESFNYFFSPDGLISNFFKKYLQPFIVTDQAPWHSKILDENSLQLSNSTLSALQKAYEFQKIFFQHNDQQILIPFTLKLLSLESNLTQLTLIIGKQQVTYENNKLSKETFIWPDPSDNKTVRVIFADESGKQSILNYDGPWGLFKLLQQHLQATSTSKHYQFTIDYNGNASTFDMYINTLFNPFSTKLFQNFSLPEVLIDNSN